MDVSIWFFGKVPVQTFWTFHIYRMKLFPCISAAEDITDCVSAASLWYSSLRPEACCLVQKEEYQQMAAADCDRPEVSALDPPYSNVPHTLDVLYCLYSQLLFLSLKYLDFGFRFYFIMPSATYHVSVYFNWTLTKQLTGHIWHHLHYMTFTYFYSIEFGIFN